VAHRGGDLLDSFGTDLHRSKDQVKIGLFSVTGRLVWVSDVRMTSNSKTVVRYQALEAGIYFVEVTWQGKCNVIKVVCLH
jgi:hypothetical protein